MPGRMVIAAALAATLWATPVAARQLCTPQAVPPVNACSAAQRTSIAVVGDVLLHRALAWRGYARGFSTLWGVAEPVLHAVDLAIANLEGPVAAGFSRTGRQVADPGPVFDDVVYTGYPRFNYHPVVIDALRSAGVDVVTTANNHALDRGAAGLDATLTALTARGMAHVGAVVGGQDRMQALRLRTPAGPLALVACSYDTNGIADPRRQVPLCHAEEAELARLVAAEAARGAGVLVLPHWGVEYSLTPDARQRRFAAAMVAAGAIAVIGTHPHVPQPWQFVDGPRGTVPVIYSTGNFVAAQPPLERATGILAWLDLCPADGGPVVAAAGYVPLQMAFDAPGPRLTLPRPGMGGRAEAGIALLERLIPGRALSLDCRSSGSLSPAPEYQR